MKPRVRNRAVGGAVAAAVLLLLALLALRYATHRFYDARYPLKYSAEIERGAGDNGLPLSLVYAVVHTESVFDPEAVSKVDARGLMQIRRDTWDWLQSKMEGQELFGYDTHCFDPGASVRNGTFLLKLLYDEYGSYELALCAYHAGRGNVNKWLKDPDISPDGETLGKIPFSDTNWYVERVMETRGIYQRLYDME